MGEPADIAAGIALGDAQLNAYSNVAGTFTYTLEDGVTPASGAVLGVGPGKILKVTFIPNHPGYSSASAQVSINVV